jgi:hypothetical protein
MATAKVTLSVVEKNGQGKRECGAAILSGGGWGRFFRSAVIFGYRSQAANLNR